MANDDDEVGEIKLPSVDSLELRRQQDDLLALMFDVKSEPPQFGHYVILHKLGRGGMGVVYAAHDPKLKRNVAIKKLHGRGDPERQRRLVWEGQVMAKLAHPNVVAVHEIGESSGATFIVMEHIEGVTLRQWLAQTPRTRTEILTIFKAAANGLIAAHEKDVVHRDFKPDNVMLGDDGRVRVMDFGLARFRVHADETASTNVDAGTSASQLTRSGALLGTIPYMAPEQLRGQKADAACDQFGYCVALYEALYGDRPFAPRTLEQRLSAIERGEIHEAPKNSAVPVWLRKIVVRGLEPRPEDRFESMQALLDALATGELAEHADGREPPEYVFVAHASVDKQAVRRLCEDLLDHGVRPWLDIWDLRPGFEWRTQMQEALRKAPAVLVCHGPGGWEERDPEFADVLRSRIEADPLSVYRVGLPGAVPGPLPVSATCDGVDLREDGWEDAIVELVRLVGADRERWDWLGYEVKHAGLSRTELCPYRGLEAFKESDARWMFGREEEIGELFGLIRAQKTRFLTVIGASGSGKSSLIMAGVCPALRNGVLGDGRPWRIAYLRPGARPCQALASALVNLQLGPESLSMIVEDLRDEMLVHDDTLRSLVDRMATSPLLLVIDQLEELFTEANLGRGNESPEALPFIRNLLEATSRSDALWVVSTLRADFVQRCLEIGVLARALKAGTYFALPPMGELQIRAAIERPAKRVGFDVDPKLLEKLVCGAAEQAGRLPLLQHVLRELWQRRDEIERVLPHEIYAETGGLEGAIAVAAERALAGLRERLGERATVVSRRVMTRLVHIGDGAHGDTRRRAVLDELECDDDTRQVLDAFVRDARVLVSDEAGGVEVIEIAHEALLREWRTLVGWLDADRGALRMRQELAADAAEFRKKRGSEYLWTKGRIDEARRLLAASTVDLNDDEWAFLEQSSRAARARSIGIWSTVAVLFVVLLGVLAFISNLNAENEWQARENERQAQENATLAASEKELRQLAEARAQENARQAEENATLAASEKEARELSEATAQENERQAQENATLAKSEKAARRVSEENLASQKGLRASTLTATAGSYIEAAILGIQAVGAFGSSDGHPPTPAAFEGLVSVLAAEPIFEIATFENANQVEFSPDGSRFATKSYDVLNSGVAANMIAQFWEVASGKLLATLQPEMGYAIFTADGSRFTDGIWVWEVASGKRLAPLEIRFFDEGMFSPDGSRFATKSYRDFAGVGTEIWEVSSGKPPITLEGNPYIEVSDAFSPDGSRIAGVVDDTVGIWDVASGKRLVTLEDDSSDHPYKVTFSPDGSRIAAANSDMTVWIWDVASGKPLAILDGHSGELAAVAFLPDGSRFATVSCDTTARIWDIASAKPLAILEGLSHAGNTVAFSPDGSRFVTSPMNPDMDRGATTQLWEVTSGKLLAIFDNVSQAAFSPDGSRLTTDNNDGTASIWDVASGPSIATLEGHSDPVTTIAFSALGPRIATVGRDRDTIRLWEGTSGKFISAFGDPSDFVASVAFSPDGSCLAVTSKKNGTTPTRLWDVSSSQILATLEGHLDMGVFSPDGSHFAALDYTSWGTIPGLWEVPSGKALAGLEGQPHEVEGWFTDLRTVVFSPDGSHIAALGSNQNHVVQLLKAPSGKALAMLEAHPDLEVTGVAFSPEGSRLATATRSAVYGSPTPTAQLWEVPSGKLLATLEGHSGDVVAVAFSPDGSSLATVGGFPTTARLWEVPSGKLLATMEAHSASGPMAFSPDGSSLATAHERNAQLWEVPSGKLLATLEGHSGELTAVAFSPDGSSLATGSSDKTGILWPMPDLAVELACGRIQHATRYPEVASICDPIVAN